MFFFQHGLSDIVVAANNYAFIDKIWADWSPTFDSGNAAQHVKDALSTPENLSAALGYYRAALGDGYKNPAYGELQSRMGGEVPVQPLLYMHGENDGCIGVDVMESSRSMSGNNVVYEIVKNAGHFLQLEQPQVVGARIADWITS
jgi:pimeloyl-ACP methyl ester carboxylesterase